MTGRMNSAILTLLLCVFPLRPAVAAEPTARQVLERSLAAQGGIRNLEAITSRVADARVEVRGLTGTYRMWAVAPNKLKTLLELNVLTQERGFDGTKGWQQQNSLEEVVGADLDRLKRSAQFSPLLAYYKEETPVELKGKETLNNQEVYQLDFTPADQPTESFYFDAKTFLPAREVRPVIVRMQKQDLIIDYSDYRKVEKILLPFHSVQTMGDQVLTLDFNSYQLNGSIDPNLFRSPADQFASEPYDVTLTSIPEKVYKENDGVWEPGPTESWYFHIVVQEKHGRTLDPVAARIEFYSEDEKVEFLEMASDSMEARRANSFGAFSGINEVFDLPYYFSRPAGVGIDRMVFKINLLAANGEKIQKTLEIPVLTYEQQAKLIFPIRGKFMVAAGHDFNEPHKSERSQHYAYDIIGLGDHYQLLKGDGKKNEDFATFGQEVLAPADGKVVYARNDVPDNPVPGKVSSELFMKLPDPERAVAGNNVIIDHGNGEFSALGHMQFGSVRVKEGDTVKQGDVIGLLGNSGNSDGPHLHYQLMAGPRFFRNDGLPSRFENVVVDQLTSESASVAVPKRGVLLVAQ